MEKQKLIFSIGLTAIIVSAIWITLGIIKSGSLIVGLNSQITAGNTASQKTIPQNQDVSPCGPLVSDGSGYNHSENDKQAGLSVSTGLDFSGFPAKLVKSGVFDVEKYKQLAGDLTPSDREIFSAQSGKKIEMTQDNNRTLLNLFWALGLIQKNESLENTELGQLKNQGQLGNLASTGGWVLGKKDATEYLSSQNILELTLEQQSRVARIASTIYRPCCGNHARFADCNHGMAMLGVLSLGVKQELSDEQLYSVALEFNEAWFPTQYSHVAQYLEKIEKTSVEKISPQSLLSAQVIGGSGHIDNIERPLAAFNGGEGVQSGKGGGCSI